MISQRTLEKNQNISVNPPPPPPPSPRTVAPLPYMSIFTGNLQDFRKINVFTNLKLFWLHSVTAGNRTGLPDINSVFVTVLYS